MRKTAHDAYAGTNETKIISNCGGTKFLPGVDVPDVYVCASVLRLALQIFSTLYGG